MTDAPPELTPRARWLTVVAVALLTAYGAWRRAIDLDPASLWLDDAWVAVLARSSALGDVFANCSSTPPLLALVIAACARVVPDPEIGAQLVPFLAGVGWVPLTGYAGWRLGGRPVVAIAAAILVAADPLAITYAARVKQYSTDGVVAALHLLALERFRATASVRLLWAWVVLGLVGVLFSTVSLFVLLGFFGAAAVGGRRDPVLRRPLALAGGVLAVGVVLLVLLVLAPSVNAGLESWWRDHFVPLTSPGAFVAAVASGVGTWLARPLAGTEDAGAALLGAGLALLGGRALVRSGRGTVALGLAAVPALLVVASAARRFPLGSGRVELFLAPLVAVALALGLTAADAVTARRWRRAWPTIACALLLLALHEPRRPRYPEQVAAPLVARAAAVLGPDDALLVNDHGLYALCYYGPWPVRFVEYPRFGTRFLPLPVGPRLQVLESGVEGVRADFLDRALRERPARAVMVLTSDYGMNEHVPRFADRIGYVVTERTATPGSVLLVLTRR